MSEVRRDPLSGETVIISPGRGDRPNSNESDAPSCPFCPGHEDETPPAVLEMPLAASESWFVRVFPNLYPIVSPSSPAVGSDGQERVEGAHEVIVETPSHEQEMHQRTQEEVRLTLMAYRHRLSTHLGTPGIQHVSVFQNRGPRAGASLDHPHSQVVALSYVPSGVTRHVRRLRRYQSRSGVCLMCREIAREQEAGVRIVDAEGELLLYAPYAAVRPGELVLAPTAHKTRFGDEGDDGLWSMAGLLLSGLKRMHAVYDELSYNLVLQTWPKGPQADPALHWYLRMIPRQSELGGFELSTGDFVSEISSEDAAAMYRDASTA
jgi:UDPglucose--hexose-1-phosphate uridylyltransferase